MKVDYATTTQQSGQTRPHLLLFRTHLRCRRRQQLAVSSVMGTLIY